MTDSLQQCEREVEQARAKLARDLTTLRSPATFSAFAEDLKQDALETKDALLDQAKEAAQSKLTGLVEDLKAKAAANPAAALTIGAGLAWQLIRHPPIATALIGAGLYSLLRTNASHSQNGYQPDYLERGKERLKEQVAELASSAKDAAAELGETVSAKTGGFVETAKEKVQEKVQEWSEGAAEGAAAAGLAVKSEVQSFAAKANRAVHDLSDQAGQVTARASATTQRVFRDTMAAGEGTIGNTESRDKVLLGVAGLAVAAALGMACQKRIAEKVD